MYKINIIIIFLMTLNFSIYSNETKKVLQNAIWIENNDECNGLIISFTEEIALINYSCKDKGFEIKSNISIKSGKIYFSDLNINYSIKLDSLAKKTRETLENNICEVISSNEKINYNYKLKCNDFIFYSYGIANQEIEYFKVDNIEIINMNGQIFEATENVKLRSEPGIKSKTIKYKNLYTLKDYNYLPKGTLVTVYGRTKEKEKVGEWENYWYYIDVGINRGIWVYGEFFISKKGNNT